MSDQEKLRGHLLEVYQLLQNAYSKEDTFELYDIYCTMDDIMTQHLINPIMH